MSASPTIVEDAGVSKLDHPADWLGLEKVIEDRSSSTPEPVADPRCGAGDEASYRGHEGFFTAFKDKVRAAWDPVSAWLTVPRSVRHRYEVRTNTIVIAELVELALDGSVHQVTAITSSGFPELDEEARRAFFAAAPFANPPMELTHGDILKFNFSLCFEIRDHGDQRDGSARP